LKFGTPPNSVRGQPNELLELNKIILEAKKAFENGNYSDCLESLEGYWPRFLWAHVGNPDSTAQVAQTPTEEAASVEAREAKTPSVPDRLKKLVPKIFQ
jgi:hypothetical protein